MLTGYAFQLWQRYISTSYNSTPPSQGLHRQPSYALKVKVYCADFLYRVVTTGQVKIYWSNRSKQVTTCTSGILRKLLNMSASRESKGKQYFSAIEKKYYKNIKEVNPITQKE